MRLPVWLTKDELDWLASVAGEQLSQRAASASAALAKRQELMATTAFNATWDEPLEAELQGLRPILPIWELSKEQLKELYDYLCAT